jgi:hypothetical protein
MRKQHGTEYKPDTLMGMVTSALRAYSTTAKEKALSLNQEPPSKLGLKDSPLLLNNLTAVMKQLHQQGLRSEHQKELSPAEHQQVLTSLQDMPESSYKHTMRGLIILRQQLGRPGVRVPCNHAGVSLALCYLPSENQQLDLCVYRAGVAAFPGLCWSGC